MTYPARDENVIIVGLGNKILEQGFELIAKPIPGSISMLRQLLKKRSR